MAGANKLVIKKPKSQIGTRNRSRRFVKHSILAKQARTLTGKKLVGSVAELNSVPEGGLSACFFQEFLDQENMQNPSKLFSTFYRSAYALVQSQALFIHSFSKLVQLLVNGLDPSLEGGEDDTFVLAVPSFLRLVGVLGRDASGEMIFAHLSALVDACLNQIQPGNVELTTLVFETIGKLFESTHEQVLREDPKLMKLHDTMYPNYLGHSSELVRNLSGEVCSFLIRQQISMNQKIHLWSLLRYTGDSRLGDATGQVFLHVVRGVKGKFHSQMPKILSSLLRALNRKALEEKDRVDSFLRWMQVVHQFASHKDEIVDIVLQEFTPCLFYYQVLQPWLDRGLTGQLHQLVNTMSSIPLEHTEAMDFVLLLWNLSNNQEDMNTCKSLVLSKPSLESLHACLLTLDFSTKFVPMVLSMVPQKWEFASLWIAISKQSCLNRNVLNSLFSEVSGKVKLSSKFVLPIKTANKKELLEFLRWVEPVVSEESKLGDMLMTQFMEMDHEPNVQVFGLWALASMIHAQGKSLSRIVTKLSLDETFCTRDGMEALCLAPLGTLDDALLLSNVSKQLAHPDRDTRLVAFKLLLGSVSPNDHQLEALKVLEEMHVLEPTYENERPREVLGDSFKRALLKMAPSLEWIPSLCYGVLGMFHIRYRPTWSLAGDLLEKLVASTTADRCWPMIFDFFQSIAMHQSTRFGESTTSSESVFTFFMKSIGSGSLLVRMFQRESAKWMGYFFYFLQHEFYPSLGEETLVECMSARELELASNVLVLVQAPSEPISGSLAKRKLNSYLEVMCAFDQKKQLAELPLLLSVWKRMLFVGANAVLALKCLQRFCGKQLEQSRSVLDCAVKTKEYRSALVEISSLFRKQNEETNPVLVDVLSRLLFSKLIEGGRQKHSVSVSERRRQILFCFSSLDNVKGFVELLLRPFDVIQLSEGNELSSFAKSATEGFLLLLEQVFPIMGKRLVPFLNAIASQLCAIIQASHTSSKQYPLLRKEALNRLDEMFRLFAGEYDFIQTFATVRQVVNKMLEHSTEDDATSALFLLLSTCFRERSIRFQCLDEQVFETYFLNKVATTQNDKVLESIFQVVDTMLVEGEFTAHFVDVFLSAIMQRRQHLVGEVLAEQELEIVERVASFARETNDVNPKLVFQLLHLLSDHLTHQRIQAKSALGLQLKTMSSLTKVVVKVMDPELIIKIRLILSKLFGPWGRHSMVTNLEDREMLSELFALYHESTAPSLLALNKMTKSSIQDDYDVPARLDAYQHLCEVTMDDVSNAVLINQALFDLMQCQDFSIRLVALAFCHHVIGGKELGVGTRDALDVGLTYGLDKVDTCAIRNHLLTVLRSVVISDHSGLFQDLRFLTSDTDADGDFFLNCSHLQPARRSKAMSRFADRHMDVCTEHSLTKVILPIATHAVFDMESKKNEQEAGILLLTACSHQFANVNTVCALLTQVFKRISKATESRTQRRLYLRAACAIYDQHAGQSPQVDAKFTKRLFVHLVSARTTHYDEELNENVALSLVARCKHKENELTNLLLVVCGQLKRRKQTARDIARQCLVKLARYLGVNRSFPIIWQHLTACLNEGGYQTHVLGYTLYQLMEAMQTETILRGTICEENTTNQLDSVLPSVLKIVLDEIFDKAAATVESGYHSKIKLREVRQGKALDTLECLANCISFLPEQSIHILVQPFLTRTREPSRNGGVAEVNKCKEAFIRLRAGLLKNPAVDQENLLVYCHHAITHQHVVNNNNGDEDEDDEEPTIPVRGAVYADRLLYVPGQQLTGSTSHEKSNKRLKQQRQSEQHREYVFIEFVLDWIQHACFDGKQQQANGMLVPMLNVIITEVCFNPLASQKSLVLGLRIVTDYLEAGGRELTLQQQEQLLTLGLQFLKRNGQSVVSADVSKSSVDLITTLLSLGLVKLKPEDTKVLIRISQLDLDNLTRFSSALRLLQCLFATLLPTPELYDIALRLNEMVFQHSIKRKEQSRCVELVSYFLLNFPLERQRLEEHVQLIVKNITHYEHETGRMGGLKLLTSILNRFPAELIDHFCDLFFITLCLVLQNDDSNQVKKETAKVLGTLFTKLTKSKFSTTVVSFMNKWFDHPKSLALACQLAGLLPNKQLFHEKLLQVVAEVRDDDNALYQALVALERALTNDAVDVERVPDLKALLLYEDLWVRQVCSRMVSSRLEAHGQLDGIEGFDLVLVLVDQLDSDQISDELAPLVLHNLVLIIQACKPAWFRGKNEIPLAWMINKLCYIASRPEPLDLGLKNRRRRVVFQFFHAVFTQSHMGMDDKLVKAVVKTLNVIHVSGLERLDPLAELKDQIVELMKQSIGVEALAAAMGKDKKFKTERRREKRAQRDVERVMPTKRIKRNV